MANLRETRPHFVRCIIPNELKASGILDAHLVMHQLHCNGVLEGIRICRKGFPNRMLYADFQQRYQVLSPADRSAQAILESITIKADQYRLGSTKVFFRSGVLGRLEDLREESVRRVLGLLQANMRRLLARRRFEVMMEERRCVSVVQRSVKRYLVLRSWEWWQLFVKLKPLLSMARRERELEALEQRLDMAEEEVEREKKVGAFESFAVSDFLFSIYHSWVYSQIFAYYLTVMSSFHLICWP
jgi:myosin heavy chain 6/7